MIELLQISQGIIERGLIFAFIVAGVYLASRIINFDNLSVEGAFGLGGAIAAIVINRDYSPWIGLCAGAIAGAMSGILTGLLHTKLKLNSLISGIVVTTGLFSIVLVIAGSNVSLAAKQTIFTTSLALICQPFERLVVLLFLAIALFTLIFLLLKTEVGYLLRAVGDAPQMITNVGKSAAAYTVFGLALSNMFAALSGALFVQYAGYFSIWAGVGVLVIGIAGMMLGQLFSSQFGIALLLGSVAYQAVIALTFELQLNQDWNKLITALLIVFLIMIKQELKKR